VCVAYAGGGPAVFRSWPATLPDWLQVVAVRLPGREALIDVPPVDRIDQVVDLLAQAMRSLRDDGTPFGLFGHSMGALICYALARRLRADGDVLPRHLFLAGRRGAHIADPLPAIHRLPRDAFLERVRALGGISDEVLQRPELLEMSVPVLRADFAICETFRYQEDAPLPCPISTFGGYDDPTTTMEQLQGWRRHTVGPFRQRMYSGNHFFIGPHQNEILRAVSADVTEESTMDGKAR
jgi:medium-chain acyl-[acyl-carrier-protein] hydrolase